MAAVGFVYGYAGSAGEPCPTFGSCLQAVVDLGPAGFSPTALIPGATAAAAVALVAYLLFLAVHGVGRAFRRPASGPAIADHPVQPVTGKPRASRSRVRPTPLLIAVCAALGWAVISVGPARLLDDLERLRLSDTVTAQLSSCAPLGGFELEGARCVHRRQLTVQDQLPGASVAPLVEYAEPRLSCAGTSVLEADGMCHRRSGGDAGFLVADLRRAVESGLLAFLAVGAAVLLWSRLRMA
jgi:hypothetical protein